jgi:hypothetical protein
MKRNFAIHSVRWLLAATLLCAVGTTFVRAEDTKAPAAPAAAAAPVRFRPATKEATSVRVTGGSRGSGESTVTLDVLAPDEIGLTTQEQPSLFWYQSKPANAKFELTLLQDNKVKPIVQVQIERSTKAGIQRLKLADYNAKLTPGVEYQWVIALVSDPDNRSKDQVASGVIKRIEPSADLKTKLAAAAPGAAVGLYADAGVWYDALSLLSDQIDADPANQTLHQTRADLLRQVGLKTAADSEVASK